MQICVLFNINTALYFNPDTVPTASEVVEGKRTLEMEFAIFEKFIQA